MNREGNARFAADATSVVRNPQASKTPGITFRVNDVSPEGGPFEVVPSFEAINEYLMPPAWLKSQLQENLLAKQEEQTTLDPLSPEFAKLSSDIESCRKWATTARIETCSRLTGELCSGLSCHPLVNAIAAAYRQHRPVILSPVMIWLTIGWAVRKVG